MLLRPRYIGHSRNAKAVEAVRALENRRLIAYVVGMITLVYVLFVVFFGLHMEPGPRQWLIVLAVLLVLIWLLLRSSIATKTRVVNRTELSSDVVRLDASVHSDYAFFVKRNCLHWNHDDLFDLQSAVNAAAQRWGEARLSQLRPKAKG